MNHPAAEAARNGPSSTLAWLVWAAAAAGALVFVVVLGCNAPYWDEWEIVPAVTGNQPLTPEYLWSLHNEHRIPLPRLVYAGVFALFPDFRAGMVLNILGFAATAAFLIAVARRVRGRGSWTDGFLALVLLNPSQAENLLWSFEVGFMLLPALLAVSTATIVGLRGTPTRAQALGIALPVVLAPLCGAAGVVVAVPMGAWLIGRAWAPRGVEETGAPAERWLLGALGASCWLLVGLYLYGYRGNPNHPEPSGLEGIAGAISEVASLALGTAASGHRPWSAALILAVVLATTAALGRWWWRSPPSRFPAEGLLAMGASTVALVLAIGWARSGFGPGAGAVSRYVALAAPLAVWVYLAWCRLPWTRLGRAIQMGCFLAALALLPANLSAGRELGLERRALLEALARDVQQGMTLNEVADRHAAAVYPDPVVLSERLAMLRRLRLGPYSPEPEASRLRKRFPFVTEPLVAVREGPVRSRAARVEGRSVVVVHANGDLVFDVRPGLGRVTGYFGLLPDYAAASPEGEELYDGTYFQATFVPDEGEPVVLFSRLLNPLRRPRDRGLRPFRVPMPDAGGRLVLSTRFGLPGVTDPNGLYDSGFWADIELQ